MISLYNKIDYSVVGFSVVGFSVVGFSVVVFSLIVKARDSGVSVKDGSPMNTSSSTLQRHCSSSLLVALSKVTAHTLNDPLHSIPLSQLDSTYQFKIKYKREQKRFEFLYVST